MKSQDSQNSWKNCELEDKTKGKNRKGDQQVFQDAAVICRGDCKQRIISRRCSDFRGTQKAKDNIDLNKAEEILNEDHYGLDKVKERVLEYLAVMQLSKGLKGPILCLVRLIRESARLRSQEASQDP